MGSDESHFNLALMMRDKVTRQCPQTTTFEEKGKPKTIRTEVLLLTSLTPSMDLYIQVHARRHLPSVAPGFPKIVYSVTLILERGLGLQSAYG